MSANSGGKRQHLFGTRSSGCNLLQAVIVFICFLLPSEVHGHLVTPVQVYNYTPESVWDAARACKERGEALPEIVDISDLDQFKAELVHDRNTKVIPTAATKRYYTSASRWNDILNGVDNYTQYKIPSANYLKTIPLGLFGGKKFWRYAENLGPDGNTSTSQALVFQDNLINDKPDPISDPWNMTLACSASAVQKYCLHPPIRPTDLFNVTVSANAQVKTVQSSTSGSFTMYLTDTQATYFCPPLMVFQHTMGSTTARPSRYWNVDCLAPIGWDPRPATMTCVEDPSYPAVNNSDGTIKYQAIQVNSARTDSTQLSVNFYEAADLCNAAGRGGLPLLTVTGNKDANGNPVPDPDLSYLLTSWSKLSDAIPLGTNNRDFDPSKYLVDVDRETAFKKSWHDIVDKTGFKFLEEPTFLNAGGELQKCLVFTGSADGSADGVMTVSCDENSFLAGLSILCQSDAGDCDIGTSEKLPATDPSAVEITYPQGVSNPYPYGSVTEYKCNCSTVFEDTENSSGSVKCYGSLGWYPAPLPPCVQVPKHVELPSGKTVFLLVPVQGTPLNHTTAAEQCFRAKYSPDGLELGSNAGLYRIPPDMSEFNMVQTLLASNCLTQGDIPVANNIQQNFVGLAPIAQSDFTTTWVKIHPQLQGLWGSSEPSWNMVSPSLCSAIRLNPWNNLTLVAKDCSSIFTGVPYILCQTGNDVCTSPAPRTNELIFDYQLPYYGFGFDVLYACPCNQKWTDTESDEFYLLCRGSLGWFPRFNKTCEGFKYQNINNKSYAVIPGPVHVVDAALACFTNFSGAVMEHRSTYETKNVIEILKINRCLRLPDGSSFGYMYMAPTAWAYKEKLPITMVQSISQVETSWRYSSDSSSFMKANLFASNEPENAEGNQQCLITYTGVSNGLGYDYSCNGRNDIGLICQKNASEALTSCHREPVNPTVDYEVKATVTFVPSGVSAPYPFGTVARFQCPCHYQWAYVPMWANDLATVLTQPSRGVVNATCLGTLDWSTNHVTYCEMWPIQNQTFTISTGNVSLVFGNFSGNHTDEATRANAEEGNAMLVITSMADLTIISDILNTALCEEAEIPVANNILQNISLVKTDGILYAAAWSQAVKDQQTWHIGEPSGVHACAVLTKRGTAQWKLAVKNCSEPSVSQVRLSMASYNTPSSGATNAPPTTCTSFPTDSSAMLIGYYSEGQVVYSDVTTFKFGTIVRHRCPCGQVLVSSTNMDVEMGQRRCYGALGWFPWDVPGCQPASKVVTSDGVDYTLHPGNNGTSGNGIVNASARCRSTSNDTFTIAEVISMEQVSKMSDLMKVHCVPAAFVAPTSWNSMRDGIANKSLVTVADRSQIWKYSNGSALAGAVHQAFAFNEPNNFNGAEQCLGLILSGSDWSSLMQGTLYDINCWLPLSKSAPRAHICAKPTIQTQNSYSNCPDPGNPTASHPVVAESSYPYGLSESPYGYSFNLTCPPGYTWKLIENSLITDKMELVSPPGGLRSPNVTVQCLGSLGWTMYDVTSCELATPCGVLDVPSYAYATCEIVSNTYQCTLFCKNSTFRWTSDAALTRLITCQANNAWTSYTDTCDKVSCNSSHIPDFPGVNRTWPNNTADIASTVTYSCPDQYSFDGTRASLNVNITVQCQSTYKWSAVPTGLTCTKVSWCDAIGLPPLSTQQGTSFTVAGLTVGNWIGDTVNYTYSDRIEVYTCLSAGNWSKTVLPKPCNAPTSVIPDYVTPTCSNDTFGNLQLCALTCKNSSLVWQSGASNRSIACQSNGTWTSYTDVCVPPFCDGSIPLDVNGVNRSWPNNSVTVGSRVTYTCPERSSFNGTKAALPLNVTLVCQENYTWSALPTTLGCYGVNWCDTAGLPSPSAMPLNVTVQGNSSVSWIGDTVNYTFSDRIEVYSCLQSGAWNKTILPKPCSPPDSIPDNVTSTCNSQIQQCTLACKNSSHTWRSGANKINITCQTNGTWTGFSDVCISAACDNNDPPIFPGVTRNWSGSRRYLAEAYYTCTSYKESFDGTRTSLNQTKVTGCSSDGSWLPAQTNLACKPVSWCDESRIPYNASDAVVNKERSGTNWINETVTLQFANRTETYVCLQSTEWNKTVQINCASPPAPPANVSMACSANLTTVQCNYTCLMNSSWNSGLPYQSIACNYAQDNWTSYTDRCVSNIQCSASLIQTFPGVSLNWTGGSRDGTVAAYFCPANHTLYNKTGYQFPNATSLVECQPTGNWSYIHTYLNCTHLPVCNASSLPKVEFGVNRVANGSDQVGDTFSDYYADRTEVFTCSDSGAWRMQVTPEGFPERIPVPTLPSYPVDFVETTLYHWGRAVENATCTGCLTGNISAPIESPGPTQFGQGVEIRGWDNECLEDNDFERRANFTCFANPMTCANGSNGISMGFFYKRGIPMKDVYLVYFNPKNSSANYPTKETLVSSGGDREGHPGIHVWWEGPFLGVLVSTGELYWEVLFLPKLFNDTWNNIGFRWFRPTPGVDDDGRLEVLINVEQQAATNQAKRASRVQSMLLPPTMLMGCHKDSTNTQKRFYGEGFFDEVAFWDTFIFDNTSRMFAGGYLPELNGVPTSVILDSIRESAKLEDERTRQVAWIAVQSIASDTNMTSEPVRPADAALNKTGETPSQQVENLVKFVTTLQSAEYISSSNSIGAVAKAARTSMSATSTLLCGNRHAWEEIADAGYKPGAYALVKSQNDYFMNMADSIAVDTKMTSAQMIDVTSDEIVSKLGVARIGHLRQSPTLKFPNYEDEIWGNGSMSKKFDYPVDTIEVPLGLYFPSSKTCDGTNLVNIEMNAYKNLDDFMPPNKVNPLKIVSQDNVIDSNILYFAFTLNKNIPKAKVAGCQPDALAMISNPIKLLFRHKMDEPAQEAGFKSRKLKFHTEEVEYNIKVRRCVWWNPSMNEFGGWDPSGCNIYDTADNFTMCECAAQGLFGILGEMIQHYELPTEPTWLTVVKFVGYGLSILCLPLFIVIVLKSKDHLHDQFHIMRANLAFALLVGLILHCVSDLHSIRDSRHACTAISVMFHYFYTAAGAWFCFESYASFVAITQGIIGGKLRAYIPLCWGLPFLSVGAALIQDMLSYGTDPRCMISFDNEMKWIFFGPLLTFASIGFLLSAIVICNISTPALRKDHIADELVSVGQGLAAQVTYFLCTWIAGVCAYFIYDWTIETPGFYALFQVLNAYTGVFYLVFMGFISLRFRMVVLGVAQKRKLMILQYLTRNQHEQLKPTPSVDNQQSDELPDELFAEGGPSSGRRKILTST